MTNTSLHVGDEFWLGMLNIAISHQSSQVILQFLCQEKKILISFLALYGDLIEPTDYKSWTACGCSGTLRSLIWEILLIAVTNDMDYHDS